jgi:kynurenine formamidase
MTVHTGTHIDAASHFVTDGRSIDQYEQERFIGEGYVLDASSIGEASLDARQLDDLGAGIREGDILFVDFGYGAYFGTEKYRQHPCITVDGAQWLVSRKVKMVCMDTMTPDLAEALRPDGFDWPVHQVLLGADILIMENVHARITSFRGSRVLVCAVPLPIRGADGAPVVPLVTRKT